MDHKHEDVVRVLNSALRRLDANAREKFDAEWGTQPGDEGDAVFRVALTKIANERTIRVTALNNQAAVEAEALRRWLARVTGGPAFTRVARHHLVGVFSDARGVNIDVDSVPSDDGLGRKYRAQVKVPCVGIGETPGPASAPGMAILTAFENVPSDGSGGMHAETKRVAKLVANSIQTAGNYQ